MGPGTKKNLELCSESPYICCWVQKIQKSGAGFRKCKNLELGSENAEIWSWVQRIQISESGFGKYINLELGSESAQFWSWVQKVQKSGVNQQIVGGPGGLLSSW